MWTVGFWKETAERAVKTFAQTAAAILVTNEVGDLGASWKGILATAAVAAAASVLTSIGSVKAGEPNSPSAVWTNRVE